MRPSLAMHCTITTATCIPLLLFLAFTVISAATSELCDPGDEAALLAVKTSLGANAKSFSTWNADTPCCQWDTISCTSGRVTSIVLTHDDTITGTIPKEISGLSALKTLRLITLPGLSGTIPAEIFSIPSLILELIDLPGVYGTIPEEISASSLNAISIKYLPGLTGSIPSSICQMPRLILLEVVSCNIHGTIPSCILEIPHMIRIDLSDNRLSGPLPASFYSRMVYSIELDLSNNFLSGDIPASLANVIWAKVDLSNNQLTGDGSVFIRHNNTELREVLLARNQLSFNLSEVVFCPNTLTRFNQLDLSQNMIYGGIPYGINEVTTLESFDVSYNLLCGEIPQGPVTARFGVSAYRGNACLCGSPLPACTTESGSAAADMRL